MVRKQIPKQKEQKLENGNALNFYYGYRILF
jgi:hypothetical protein